MIDTELSMIIVSYSFENFIWKIIKETGRAEEYKILRPRKKWIEKLSETKIFKTSSIFNRCLDLRDRAVHPWLKKLNPVEREEFIDSLEKLILKEKANNL